jgi:hypothetical protein
MKKNRAEKSEEHTHTLAKIVHLKEGNYKNWHILKRRVALLKGGTNEVGRHNNNYNVLLSSVSLTNYGMSIKKNMGNINF